MSVKVREKPKGSGEWWMFINHQGLRKAKKIGNDKNFAMEVAKKVEARLVLGDFNLDENTKVSPLLKDYAKVWLNGYIKGMRRISTYDRYRVLLDKYVLPYIGNIPINQLKRGDVKKLLIGLHKQGLSKSTVSLVYSTLSGIMIHALDEELIQINPVSGITKQLKLDRDKKITINPMDPQEVSLFLDKCLEYYPKYYSFFLTAFRTGMRLGELLGLQWSDVDWNKKYILVKRSYKTGILGLTKSGKERRVDMSKQLFDELQSLYETRKLEAMREGKGSEVIEIIFHRNGKHLEQNHIRRIFKRILRLAGIPEMRLHDIRHTYASLLLTNGYSPVYVKEQMGHHSIQITVDTYGHLIPSSNREAVDSLDDATNRNLSATKNI